MINELASPEVNDDSTGTVLTATHEAHEVAHRPHQKTATVTRHVGVLDANGKFVRLWSEETVIRNRQLAARDPDTNDPIWSDDYDDLMASKPNGKKAGFVRSDDFRAKFDEIRQRPPID